MSTCGTLVARGLGRGRDMTRPDWRKVKSVEREKDMEGFFHFKARKEGFPKMVNRFEEEVGLCVPNHCLI